MPVTGVLVVCVGQPRTHEWRFGAAGRPGLLLRPLVTGTLQAGDAVTVEHRPVHGVRTTWGQADA